MDDHYQDNQARRSQSGRRTKIAATATEIRRGWSDAEWASRSITKGRVLWTVPEWPGVVDK